MVPPSLQNIHNTHMSKHLIHYNRKEIIWMKSVYTQRTFIFQTQDRMEDKLPKITFNRKALSE